MFLLQPSPRRTATSRRPRTHATECCDQREVRHLWFLQPEASAWWRPAGALRLRGRLSQDAELIPLWVGEDHPGRVALTNIDQPGSQGGQSGDLMLLVVGPQIDVQSVLLDLRLSDAHEEQAGDNVGTGANLELIILVVNDDPLRGVSPPCAQPSKLTPRRRRTCRL